MYKQILAGSLCWSMCTDFISGEPQVKGEHIILLFQLHTEFNLHTWIHKKKEFKASKLFSQMSLQRQKKPMPGFIPVGRSGLAEA